MKTRKTVFLLLIALMALMLAACDNSNSAPDGGGVDRLTPVKGTLDESHPYDAYHHGLFDNQTYSSDSVNAGFNLAAGTTVKWSAYIPADFQVKSSVYVVLTPDNTTAYDFARSEVGMQWIDLADSDEDPFAVVFVEPQDGGTWNTTAAPDGREDVDAAFVTFTGVRDKSSTTNAFISVDKSGVRLVGYEEGADMAALWASAWPQLWANTTLINPTQYDEDTIKANLDSTIFPYAIDGSKGYDEGMTARQVAMPMFLYGDEEVTSKFESLYTTINNACTNPDPSRDKSLEVVKVLADSSASTIYDSAKQNNRFLGYPGGTIRGVFGAYTGKNFHPVWEEEIGGYTRRWLVYVPDSYVSSKPTPLVVALHGSSASVTDLPEESRWTDIADKNGFIVVFVQGYPAGSPNPIPSWFSLEGGAQTDIDYIKTVVDRIDEEYNIDRSKMYLTGHSLGSMMTQMFASSEDRGFFAAYGPVGSALAGDKISSRNPDAVDPVSNKTLVPMWFFKGQYDINGNAIDGSKGGDTEAFEFWAEDMNKLTDKGAATPETEGDYYGALPSGKYTTTSYTDGDVPVVRYTQVSQSPHTYMAEESDLLWSWFQSWSRGENGEALYNGSAVVID